MRCDPYTSRTYLMDLNFSTAGRNRNRERACRLFKHAPTPTTPVRCIPVYVKPGGSVAFAYMMRS